MTATDFNLTGLRIKIFHADPNGINDHCVTGTVLSQHDDLLTVESDEDLFGETEILLAYADEVEVIVPTVLIADETDPAPDAPLIDPDAVDGVYRLI